MSAGGAVATGGGGNLRALMTQRIQASRYLREKKGATSAAAVAPSDYDFFKNFVLNVDWDETTLREKLLDAIMKGKNLNARSERDGTTVLHDACSSSSLSVVSALLRSKANPHIRSNKKRTALHYAAINRDPRVAELVWQNLDNPTRRLLQRDASGFTPLDFACSIGNGLTAKFFFDRFPRAELGKIVKKDNLKRTLLHLLLTGFPKDNLQEQAIIALIAEAVETRPQDVWSRDKNGATPLSVHVTQHVRSENMAAFATVLSKLSAIDTDKALYLMFLEKGGQSTEWMPEKWLVLQRMMTSSEHAKFVPVALQFVSESTTLAKDPSGRTLLHWLAIFGFQPSLIDAVSSFKTDDDDQTQFQTHPGTGVEMPVLSKAQAWLSGINNIAWTVALEREDVKRILEEMKGKTLQMPIVTPLCIFDKNKDTPLFVAAKYNNPRAISHLYRVFGDEIKTWKDAAGNNALHIAAMHNAGLALIELRTTCAWELEEMNNDGYTAYMIALQRKHLVSAALLKAYDAVSEGLVAKDGARIEDLEAEHTKFAIKIAARREERRAKQNEAMESEDDADWSSTERHSDDEKDTAESEGSTGSVEIKHVSDDEELDLSSGSGSEDENEDHRNGKSVFKPHIKVDSEYDEEEPNGTINGHKKPKDKKPHTRGSLRGGSKISKEDEYEKSGSSDEENNSMEEKSSGSGSPPLSPRSPRDSSPLSPRDSSPRSPLTSSPRSPRYSSPPPSIRPHTNDNPSLIDANSVLVSPRLKQEISELKSQNAATHESLSKSQAELARSKERINELEAEELKQKQEMATLKSQLKEEAELRQKAEEKMAAAALESSQKLAQLQTDLQASLSSSQAKYAELQASLSSSQAKYDALLSSKTFDSQDWEAKLKSSQASQENAHLALEAAKEEVKAMHDLLSRSQSENSSQLKEKDSKLLESASKVSEVTEELLKLTDTLNKSQQEQRTLRNQLDKLSTDLSQSQARQQQHQQKHYNSSVASSAVVVLFAVAVFLLFLAQLDSFQQPRSYAYLS